MPKLEAVPPVMVDSSIAETILAHKLRLLFHGTSVVVHLLPNITWMIGEMIAGSTNDVHRAWTVFAPRQSRYVPYASASNHITNPSHDAGRRTSGAAPKLDVTEMAEAESSITRTKSSVPSGSDEAAARPPAPPIITSAPAAENKTMAPTLALSLRKHKAFTPLHADSWEQYLHSSALTPKYPTLVNSIRHGFNIGIPHITHTNTPFNSPTLQQQYNDFQHIISHELQLQQYLGPFTRREVESLLGPFQTSPMSLIPKPHKPNVYQLIQNYSYPYNATPSYQSINSYIDSSNYPCTWGTFNAFLFAST